MDIEITKKRLEELTYTVVGAAIEVHKEMGSGLLESVYHQCMKKEFLHSTWQKTYVNDYFRLLK